VLVTPCIHAFHSKFLDSLHSYVAISLPRDWSRGDRFHSPVFERLTSSVWGGGNGEPRVRRRSCTSQAR
jgi:hypothetical protein